MTSVADNALIALDNITDYAGNLFSPSLRFGVTGLSRAGKTVFITSLVHNLLHGGRLPMFDVVANGRLTTAALQPQPSMALPRFAYEEHIETLLRDRQWPESTKAITELRLTLKFESASAWNRAFGAGSINIDIVDYPGEWLLDLPLLDKSFDEWSTETIEASAAGSRSKLGKKWKKQLQSLDVSAELNEVTAKEYAATFTAYLHECREGKNAMSSLPPGRFLMPGDLEGSPALTFAPLAKPEIGSIASESLYSQFEKRYEAYKSIVVKPFFREHFARLDRQIVLVDALQAFNAGDDAIRDLETALGDILGSFRPGSSNWLWSILTRRIDRVLFAATKADHLHHEDHRKLEALLSELVDKAIGRVKFSGADVDVIALSAVRATREGYVDDNSGKLPVVIGTPLKGQMIANETFDGKTETAVFPGDLPETIRALSSEHRDQASEGDMNFVRFRPPKLEKTSEGLELSLPHIRLDRALEFLFGDQLA